MEIQSTFNAGVQGFQKAQEDATQAAADIASNTKASEESFAISQQNQQADPGAIAQPQRLSSSTPPPDLSESVVNLKVAEFQAKSSAEVIKTADDNLGTLLDVRI